MKTFNITDQDVTLTLASKNDRIVTLRTSQLNIKNATKGKNYLVGFYVNDRIVYLQFTSNRVDKTTLALPITLLPRGIKLPRIGKGNSTKVIVVSTESVY